MRPTVTVGVCARNCERTIESTILSILEQDFCKERMELIFVDDGSEDGTSAVVGRYVSRADMDVRVFSSGWRGLGASRNTVVDYAKGDFIIWVDGDMVLPRDFVRKQVEFMERNPDVGIGKGMYGICGEASLCASLENIEAVLDILDYENVSQPLGTGGCIYRAEAIRDVGGFEGKIRGAGEDVDAECRIKEAGWSLRTTPAIFYEIRRQDWKSLWNEYLWHGSGGYYVLDRIVRHRRTLLKIFPPAAMFFEFSRSCAAYKLMLDKAVFLLPFHWTFKRVAWCVGFAMACLRDHIRPP